MLPIDLVDKVINIYEVWDFVRDSDSERQNMPRWSTTIRLGWNRRRLQGLGATRVGLFQTVPATAIFVSLILQITRNA